MSDAPVAFTALILPVVSRTLIQSAPLQRRGATAGAPGMATDCLTSNAAAHGTATSLPTTVRHGLPKRQSLLLIG